jgi:hypothetical protein
MKSVRQKISTAGKSALLMGYAFLGSALFFDYETFHFFEDPMSDLYDKFGDVWDLLEECELFD